MHSRICSLLYCSCHLYPVNLLQAQALNMEKEFPHGTKEGWVVRGSRESRHCINFIRTMDEEIFQDALRQRNPEKHLIKLSIGK